MILSSLCTLGTCLLFLPGAGEVLSTTAMAAPGARDGRTAELTARHLGPEVAAGTSGPARFISSLMEAFDPEQALQDAAYIDGWYRTPGGEGYRATLERVEARLSAAGFGESEELELVFLDTEMRQPSWTPRSGCVTLRVEGEARVLHAFSQPGDRDRTMLPVNAPAADILGRPVFTLEDVQTGTVLVTGAPISRSLIRRATKRGALGLLSSALHPFTIDPTGQRRHEDAIRFSTIPAGTTLPVAQISPRSRRAIERASSLSFGTTVSLTAGVEFGGTRLRTLVAAVRGSSLPGEAVVIASHAQEPGAGDNASGVAGVVESACSLVQLLRSKKLDWPARTIVFVIGDEIQQSELFLEHTDREVIAGISADMLGQSFEQTGAIALLERMQDPGALVPLEPDDHTPWGAGAVDEEDLRPNGLALIARTALVDVGRAVGGWATSENPWEGGSDHDVFLRREIPAVLLWHFTDFTYHTSLDRMDMLDMDELRRSCVAIMGAVLAVADARPADLDRYLATNELERELRVRAAHDANEREVANQWEWWCDGAAKWLDELCQGD
ncbi:MAG: aminopeptidase YwaD [Chlamydiales bacterium]|jgi:aminopeptidase YwaD